MGVKVCEGLFECLSVCVECVCMCVSVCERERERELVRRVLISDGAKGREPLSKKREAYHFFQKITKQSFV